MNRGAEVGGLRGHTKRALEIHRWSLFFLLPPPPPLHLPPPLIPGITFYSILLNETEQSSAVSFQTSQISIRMRGHGRLRRNAYTVSGARMETIGEKNCAGRIMFFLDNERLKRSRLAHASAVVCLVFFVPPPPQPPAPHATVLVHLLVVTTSSSADAIWQVAARFCP